MPLKMLVVSKSFQNYRKEAIVVSHQLRDVERKGVCMYRGGDTLDLLLKVPKHEIFLTELIKGAQA
jgi:hypothetical protein